MASPEGEPVTGKHDYEFEADFAIDEHEPAAWADEYDLLVVPGGRAPERLRIEAPEAADVVTEFVEEDLPWRRSATARSSSSAPTFSKGG